MAVYIGGKNAGLNAALAGLDKGLGRGLEFGDQSRRTKLAEDQYRAQVERANRLLDIEEAQNRRAEEDQTVQREQRAAIDEGQKEISSYALDYQGPDQVVGGGLGAFADLESAQAAKAARAKGVASKLHPSLQKQFLGEVSAEMEDEQNIALLDHLKTRLTKAGASPLRSEGGELGHLGEERASQLQSWQEAAEMATTPEARAQIVPKLAEGLSGLHRDDAIELKRLRTVARVADSAKQDILRKQQRVDAAKADHENPEIIADMEASLEAMEATVAFYEASGGEMTATQLNSAMNLARGARAPRPSRGSGAGGGADNMRERELDVKIRGMADEKAQAEWDKLSPDEQKTTPFESLWAKHYQRLGGKGDRDPREEIPPGANDPMSPFRNHAPGAAPIDNAPPAKKFTALPKESQAGFSEAVAAAIAEKNPQAIPEILAQFGVEDGSIPDDVMQELIGAPKKKRNEGAQKMWNDSQKPMAGGRRGK